MLQLYKPKHEDLEFRETLISDEQTMSYNKEYGGVIYFPKSKWQKWYQKWLNVSECNCYYRYLYDDNIKEYVGEIAYSFDGKRKIHICSIIILAKYRKQGYGTQAIQLLCEEAKKRNIKVLYDEISVSNDSYKLFLKNGFIIDYTDDEVIIVKKEL